MTDTVERKALTREQLLSAYRMMRAIREFEERVHAEFATGEIPGFVHLYAGEEASAVGTPLDIVDPGGAVEEWPRCGAGHVLQLDTERAA